MKSSIFCEILNEEYIEVNKSVSETIQCLHEQSGVCTHSSTKDITVYFECSKRGKIRVESSFGREIDFRGVLQIYYVCGDVVSRNHKTYVKMTSIYRKIDILLRGFLLAFVTVLFSLLLIITSDFYLPAVLFSIIILFVLIFYSVNITTKRKQQGLNIIKTMENEIKKRVQNIERWDD